MYKLTDQDMLQMYKVVEKIGYTRYDTRDDTSLERYDTSVGYKIIYKLYRSSG